jgi:molybdenum cofactor cytidylyltransferase
VLSAIVLAAGDSTRMGSPKALLLTSDGHPFITSIVGAFAAAGIADVVVVTGRDHDAVVAALRDHPAPLHPRFARNPDPSRGQLSSLWAGMDVIPASAEAVLMTLVDVPLIGPGTIRAVIAAWEQTRAPIVRPAIGERHGHPVLFDRRVFGELRAAPLDAGAKTVVRRHASDLVNVPVTDERCLVDIDTPEDYRSLRAW